MVDLEGGEKYKKRKKKPNVWCNRGTPSDLNFLLSTEAVIYFTFTLFHSIQCCRHVLEWLGMKLLAIMFLWWSSYLYARVDL